MKTLNVLVACEESQRVCMAFREYAKAQGFVCNAYSCDLLECSGEHPEYHFNMDVLEVIKNHGGVLQNGEECHIEGEWDIMIAHPPCTFLSSSGARWYYDPADKDLPYEERRPHPNFPTRRQDREDGAAFFMKLATEESIKYIAVENPIGIMSTRYKKPEQIVQPYFFGDEASKSTCLWLKNLPPLERTHFDVGAGEMVVLSSGKKLPKWYSDALTQAKTPAERRTLRSKTFPGIAREIARQWSDFVLKEKYGDEDIC